MADINRDEPFTRQSRILPIALGLLFISVGLNILSARRISTLQRHAESQSTVVKDATVPDIVGLDLAGSPTTLHYADASVPTVLYVFTPQCGWCKKNLPNLHSLINQAGSRYRVVGIALTRQDLISYLTEQHLNLPVYTDIRSDIREAYRLGGTPETIVVSSKGTVLKVWHGAYIGEITPQIQESLQIHLPGCCPS